jgi:hypothetical protein
MTDHDPSGSEHLLDHAQAQRKSEVQPNCMGNDLGWESMALVADGFGRATALRVEEALIKGSRDITPPSSQLRKSTPFDSRADGPGRHSPL